MTIAPTAPARPVIPSGDDRRPRLERADLRLVTVFVVLLVLTQRVGIPVADSVIAVALPMAYVFAGVFAARRLLVVSWLRAGLLALAISACMLTTVAVSSLGFNDQISMFSLWFLIAIYVPWVLRMGGPHGAAVVRRAGHTFVWTMVVVGSVGVVQLAIQLAGVWQLEDYLELLLTDEYLVADYNFDNELTYGLGIYKSQAFILPEPSFLSQYCALAIILGIMLRVRAWKLLVLAAGLASAVSGTGLMLLAAGGLLLLLRAPRRLRPAYVLAGVVTAALVVLSPVATFLFQRQDELGTERTSGNGRFVAPYREAWEGLQDVPSRYWVGAGPGSVERVIPGTRVGANGSDVLYSIVPKLAFEYGLIAGALVAAFLLFCTLYRAPWRVIPGALIVMTFFLSGALLQPQTAYLAWMLSVIGATAPLKSGAAGRGG